MGNNGLKEIEGALEFSISFDSDGIQLGGAWNYIFQLPPDIPVNKFWSVIVYDKKTGLIIQTDQKWPSVFSNCKRLSVNNDDSIDIYFGPSAPDGKEGNWIKTIPGDDWKMIIRLYGHTECSGKRTWKPGEIQKMK